MKKRIVMICALLVSGTLAFAQKSSKNALEQMGQPVEKAYKAVEKGVVDGYKAVEKTFVDGYKSVENAFVEPFNDTLSKSVHYRKRYRADIELSYHVNDSWFFTTSHGYGFGNGLYIGGGSGFGVEYVPDYYAEADCLLPLFADLKYSFLNKAASPFLSLKAGGYANVDSEEVKGIRLFVNPAIGVEIKRFSIRAGYEYQHKVWGIDKGANKHNFKCSVAFTF